jgi:hypothetical protein
MSNYGNFYLDYPSHSALEMWFDIRGANKNETQVELLLGGEVSVCRTYGGAIAERCMCSCGRSFRQWPVIS